MQQSAAYVYLVALYGDTLIKFTVDIQALQDKRHGIRRIIFFEWQTSSSIPTDTPNEYTEFCFGQLTVSISEGDSNSYTLRFLAISLASPFLRSYTHVHHGVGKKCLPKSRSPSIDVRLFLRSNRECNRRLCRQRVQTYCAGRLRHLRFRKT